MMDAELMVSRIRERMIALQITSARQLAHMAGLDNVSVSKVLGNRRPYVSAPTVVQLAAALQCSVDYLFGLVDEPTGTGVVMPDGGEEMLRLLAGMTFGKRVELLDVAAVMVESEQQRRERRYEQFEQLEAELRAVTTPGEYRAVMGELFRAVRAHDAAALDALLARYRTPPESDDELGEAA